MIEWWNSLEPAMKVLWAVTLSASLVFVIQTVMTFLGAAGDSDFDINSDVSADTPGDIADGSVDVGGGPDAGGHDAAHPSTGMNLLTFRNFINFLIGFGWTAILLQKSVPATGLRMLIAIVVGLVLAFTSRYTRGIGFLVALVGAGMMIGGYFMNQKNRAIREHNAKCAAQERAWNAAWENWKNSIFLHSFHRASQLFPCAVQPAADGLMGYSQGVGGLGIRHALKPAQQRGFAQLMGQRQNRRGQLPVLLPHRRGGLRAGRQ